MQNPEPPPGEARYSMVLFITGATRLSLLAVENVQKFCEQELDGNYELEIVDLYRAPERAVSAQIIALPTLLRNKPLPKRFLIGRMTDLKTLRDTIKVVSP